MKLSTTWMKQRYILRNDLLGSFIFQGGDLADNFSFMGKFGGTISSCFRIQNEALFEKTLL